MQEKKMYHRMLIAAAKATKGEDEPQVLKII